MEKDDETVDSEEDYSDNAEEDAGVAAEDGNLEEGEEEEKMSEEDEEKEVVEEVNEEAEKNVNKEEPDKEPEDAEEKPEEADVEEEDSEEKPGEGKYLGEEAGGKEEGDEAEESGEDKEEEAEELGDEEEREDSEADENAKEAEEDEEVEESEEEAEEEAHKKAVSQEARKSIPKEPQKASWVKDPFVRYGVYIVVALAVIIIFMRVSSSPTAAAVFDDPDKPNVEFYVMSQCPYGTQVEDAIAPVLKNIGSSIDFRLDFIANEAGGSFSSLHGEPEVQGDIVQLCAMKYEPAGFMGMIVCMNENAASIPSNWEACAKSNGLNVNNIKKCYEGSEGKSLLSASIKRSAAAGASGSPTMFIGGKPYNGMRDSLSFQKAICSMIDDPACASTPECTNDAHCTAQPAKEGFCEQGKCAYKEPLRFELIVLNDKNCKSCDTSQILGTTRQLFLGARERYVDTLSDEGEQLIDSYGIEVVPAYLFDAEVAETSAWKNSPNLRTAFERNADKFKLLDDVTGATWFVSEEARQRYYDSISLSPGDNRPQIDFFVMSYCPYGNLAEEAVYEAYKVLNDKAEFIPHYVVYSNYQGGSSDFCIANGTCCSMHGIQELNQDIRELCVYRDSGIKAWFDFAIAMNTRCNAGNADTCWQAVADDLQLDAAKISECQEKDGESIIKKDRDLNKVLGVSGSPTVFVEGEPYNGARSGEGYKNALCAAFDKKPDECSTVIASTEQAAPSGACG